MLTWNTQFVNYQLPRVDKRTRKTKFYSYQSLRRNELTKNIQFVYFALHKTGRKGGLQARVIWCPLCKWRVQCRALSLTSYSYSPTNFCFDQFWSLCGTLLTGGMHKIWVLFQHSNECHLPHFFVADICHQNECVSSLNFKVVFRIHQSSALFSL